MHAYGAQQLLGISTVEGCRTYCAQLTSCLAFDFRRSNSGCYPHFDAADLDIVAEDPDLDYYIKLTCEGTSTSFEFLCMDLHSCLNPTGFHS